MGEKELMEDKDKEIEKLCKKAESLIIRYKRGEIPMKSYYPYQNTNYGYKTEIIVASIRHPLHVLEAAKIGADVATIPFNVLEKLIKHPLTDIGIDRFLKDWQKLSDKEKAF